MHNTELLKYKIRLLDNINPIDNKINVPVIMMYEELECSDLVAIEAKYRKNKQIKEDVCEAVIAKGCCSIGDEGGCCRVK
ncbi:MAG: hypothetical protein QXK37_02660 [Candidatus Woesearchaeota archaeon]